MGSDAIDALQAVDVVKHYDGVRALQGVSLDLRANEIVGLIGPNGSGKTTLLNCLSGAVAPTSGRLMIDGRDCTGLPSHRISRLGVARTFQNIRLFTSMSLSENVEVAIADDGRGARRRIERAQQILDELDLSSVGDRSVAGLPYGLQRRLEVARAVASRPQYLLLDEPAAGMNDAETDELLLMLQRGGKRWGCAILIVDHDLTFIMRLCSTIHVLNEGSTIAIGSPREVQRDPKVIAAYLGGSDGAEA